jgi:hypothetical protein
VPGNEETPAAVASATAPALPSLKKDNCIRNGRHRSVFRAEESIRLYIQKYGEANCALLTVTTPSECLESKQFQTRWHSFLSNALRKQFTTGMWTRERQPRSGNWHCHAVVNVGWDVRTDFPFKQVIAGFYASVDPKLRELWNWLRESAGAHGFGRTELIPLKHSGRACASYLVKYLAKAFDSEKCVGEERCRLFGAWGRDRFVFPGFTFLSSRITQKRKQWLAEALGLADERSLKVMLGPHWWFHFGKALSEVILPMELYKIGPSDALRWDDLGLNVCARDWANWPGKPTNDLLQQSHFNLFWEIGAHLYGTKGGRASEFAFSLMATPEPFPPKAEDPQLWLAVDRTNKNSSP